MDIIELGAIGELVGGLAVLITLLYLAAQFRQGTHLARGESTREVNNTFREAVDGLADHRSAFVKGLHRFEGLSKDEQWRFSFLISPLVVALDQTIAMHHQGLETAGTVETNGNVVLSMLRERGGREWWELAKPFYRGLHVFDYVETQLRDPSPSFPPISASAPWFEPDDPAPVAAASP